MVEVNGLGFEVGVVVLTLVEMVVACTQESWILCRITCMILIHDRVNLSYLMNVCYITGQTLDLPLLLLR